VAFRCTKKSPSKNAAEFSRLVGSRFVSSLVREPGAAVDY
jgi:hypothetical protein